MALSRMNESDSASDVFFQEIVADDRIDSGSKAARCHFYIDLPCLD